MKFIIRWIVAAIAVGAAVWLVPGITAVGGSDSMYAIAITALVLGFVDAVVKPIVKFISLPATIVTLGLFLLVVNAAMLVLASWLSTNLFGMGIVIDDLGSAVIGAVIVSIVTALMNGILGVEKK